MQICKSIKYHNMHSCKSQYTISKFQEEKRFILFQIKFIKLKKNHNHNNNNQTWQCNLTKFHPNES